MEHSTVHTLLEDLTTGAAPASTVDIPLAIRTGQRRIRRRRALASGSVALMVVVTLAVVLGVTRLPVLQPADPSPTPRVAPTAFNPLTVYAELRRLPFTPDRLTVTTGVHSLVIVASEDTQPTGSVRLTVVTANHEIANPLADPVAVRPGTAAHGQPTDALNGRRAEWTWAGTDTAALRWEYAPTAWAEVSVAGLPGDPQALARQLAGLVRFGVDTPVKLPFPPGGVRSTLTPRLVMTTVAGPENWRAAVYYGPPDSTTGDLLTLSVTASRPSIVDSAAANTTVDGHPAAARSVPDGQSWLDVYDVHGVDVTIAASDHATQAGLPGGGFAGLFRTLELKADPSDWK
jgi:hypothetical protein